MLRHQAKAAKAAKQPKKVVAKKQPKKQVKRTVKTSARKIAPKSLAAFAPTLPVRSAEGSNPNAPNGWVEGPGGVKRPISPSIQIWKFSPTAYLHVGSRICGAVLAGSLTMTGLYGAAIGCDITPAIDAVKINAPIIIPVWKMAVVFPLTYHALHGAKQLYQDFTAKGYDEEFQEKANYAIAGAATAATLYGSLIV